MSVVEDFGKPSRRIDFASQDFGNTVKSGSTDIANPNTGIDTISFIIEKISLNLVCRIQNNDDFAVDPLVLEGLKAFQCLPFCIVQTEIVSIEKIVSAVEHIGLILARRKIDILSSRPSNHIDGSIGIVHIFLAGCCNRGKILFLDFRPHSDPGIVFLSIREIFLIEFSVIVDTCLFET